MFSTSTEHKQSVNPFKRFTLPINQRMIVALIILLAILLRLPLLFEPLNYSASDAWRQADTASIAHNFVHEEDPNFNIFYPQINWGGNSEGYVETEFQLYPFIVGVLYTIFGEHVSLGRLVSLLFTIATFVVLFELVKRKSSSTAAYWALLFITFSPLHIRYSTAFMPEATVLFFYVLSLYLFLRWLKSQVNSTLILCGVSTAMAILVKPTSIHIGLIFFLLLYQRYKLSFIKQPVLWLFGLISLVPGILWYLHARNLYLTYNNTFGLLSGGDSKFASAKDLVDPLFYIRLAYLDTLWIFAGIGALLFVIGLALAVRNKLLLLPFATITILIYYVIVGRYSQHSWGIQYHVYALPYAGMGIGIAMAWIAGRNIGRLKELLSTNMYYMIPAALVAVYLSMSFVVMYFKVYAPAYNNVVACADYVGDLTSRDDLIIVSSTDSAIDKGTPNNFQNPQVFFYSHRIGWSLAADRHEPDVVEKMRQAGARYFVIYDQELYEANPELVTYLGEESQQIGPGVANDCGIYKFVD